MAGIAKRIAEVPLDALSLAEAISKADLLEAAWHLAGLANGSDSAEDEEATLRRLHEEINTLRANRGARALPALVDLQTKWHAARASRKAMVERWSK